jgi:hypothetical protein
MTSPEVGALRLARAFGFGLTAYALAVVAHAAGGGGTPTLTGSLVLAFATVWVSVLLTSRRLGVGSSVLSLGVVQLLLHEGLALASSAGGCMSVVHSHGSHLASGAMMVCSPAGAPDMHAHGGATVAMTAAHAVAALCLGVLLARGDQAVWFLAALVWPRLPEAGVVGVLVPRVPASARARLVARRPLVVLSGLSRRGPPRACAPVAA